MFVKLGEPNMIAAKIALFASASIAVLALIPSVAAAQESAAVSEEVAGDSADIVVTAQRRQERAQDIPVAISAFGGERLERRDCFA